MFLLHCRLKHIKRRLKEWNKKEFGNIFKDKGDVKKKLKEINKMLITEGYTDEKKAMAESLQQEWDNKCLQEEIFWRQKSIVQWIKEGERNTKFFQRSTIAHRNNNRIVKLTGQHGIERNTHEEMRREDNYNLNRPVTEEEIEEVVKEMQNGKAPGPDGFNVDFFKAFWRIVKQDILEVVEDSRKFKTVLKALNESFIALIPKQEKATSLDRFRPIALCNVI
eukprot:PITA_08575